MINPALEQLGNADGAPNVVLLTGADRLSVDSVAFSLADSVESVCSIVYDVRADEQVESGLSVVRTITEPIRSGDTRAFGASRVEAYPMDGCCLTCSVKHDLARTLETLQHAARLFLVSLPIGVEGVPVAQYLDDSFSLGEWSRRMGVAAIVNAVELDGFQNRLFDDDRLCLCGTDEDDCVFEERSTGVVVARLLREASHVLELPVFGAGCLSRHDDAEGECACRNMIRALADRDAIVYEDAHQASMNDIVNPRAAVMADKS